MSWNKYMVILQPSVHNDSEDRQAVDQATIEVVTMLVNAKTREDAARHCIHVMLGWTVMLAAQYQILGESPTVVAIDE